MLNFCHSETQRSEVEESLASRDSSFVGMTEYPISGLIKFFLFCRNEFALLILFQVHIDRLSVILRRSAAKSKNLSPVEIPPSSE